LDKGQFILSYDCIVFLSAHPCLFVCLCLAMITWLVTWEQTWIQVIMSMLSATGRGYRWGIFFMLCFPTFCNRHYDVLSIM